MTLLRSMKVAHLSTEQQPHMLGLAPPLGFLGPEPPTPLVVAEATSKPVLLVHTACARGLPWGSG